MEFRKIEISDKKYFEEKVDSDTFCENCCGYERIFQVIYCFSRQYNYSIAKENGALFVKFEHNGRIGFFPPVVKYPHEFLSAFESLHKYCKENNIKLKMYGADQVKVDLIAGSKQYMMYHTTKRDSFEYLYKPEKLINMGDYSPQKRNMLKSFEKRFKWEFREYLPSDKEQVFALLKEWGQEKHEEGDLVSMREAIERLDELGLCCDVLLVAGKIVGIDIGYIARDVGIIMYEKVSKKIFGAGVKIVQEFSKKRFADCRYINRQEDMGDAGLRNSKLSYGPDKFIVKHNIEIL